MALGMFRRARERHELDSASSKPMKKLPEGLIGQKAN
jgi:hypothetical protein